jgi:hypothetical protein
VPGAPLARVPALAPAAATATTGTARVIAAGRRLFVSGNDRTLGKEAGIATTVPAATAEVKDAPKVATASASAQVDVDAAAATPDVDAATPAASEVDVDADG